MFTNDTYAHARSQLAKWGWAMSNREILQAATEVLKTRYPSLNAEAMIAFMVIADFETPTIGEIAVAMQLSDMQVFQYMGPLRTAGLVGVEPHRSGSNVVTLTDRGKEAKQAVEDIFSG